MIALAVTTIFLTRLELALILNVYSAKEASIALSLFAKEILTLADDDYKLYRYTGILRTSPATKVGGSSTLM